MLCEWKSPHNLVAHVYYRKGEVPDGEGTVVGDTVRYDLTFAAQAVSGGYLLRARFPHQKCSGVRLEIEDTDGEGESYSISAIMLEVGMKRGMHLSAEKTV